MPYLEFDPVAYTEEFVLTRDCSRAFLFELLLLDHLPSQPLRIARRRIHLRRALIARQPVDAGRLAPVFLGGIFVGLLHGAVMHWMRAATRASPYKGLFYLAMMTGIVMWGFNWDPITLNRALVRSVLAAVLLWHIVVRPLLGRTAMTKAIRWRQTYPLMAHRA